MSMFLQIVKSWQVLAATGVIVLYIFLVNYVARAYHKPSFISKSRPKKVKAEAAPKPASEEEDSNEALGLEER